ncbi:hypothetical protein OCU04_004935 [Sclerotinia nivalis]|uniref:GS catalytic domain-containing protein n=1 Tax=Sclerotinia nivalis TaxID=352851 RepID=A0A9X0ARG9_9HELO|nr:hypothetical protein OCU04_004935 [Sclerotinia nivalis]
MCFVKEMSLNFPSWKRDPRSMLQQTLDRAKKTLGLQFLVGFELEFHLTQVDGDRAIKQTNQFYSAAVLRDGTVCKLLEECIRSLLDAGIAATHFQTEGGQGMFEIPTGPLRQLKLLIPSCIVKRLYRQSF